MSEFFCITTPSIQHLHSCLAVDVIRGALNAPVLLQNWYYELFSMLPLPVIYPTSHLKTPTIKKSLYLIILEAIYIYINAYFLIRA